MIKTNQAREMIDIVNKTGVAHVKMCRMAIGKYDKGNLEYIKTDPLGACVTFTLYDPLKQMCIFQHIAITNDPIKSLKELKKLIKKNDLNTSQLQARIIGGGCDDESVKEIPEFIIKNIYDFIEENNINLIEQDILGDEGKCIVLSLKDGKLYDYPFTYEAIDKEDLYIETIELPTKNLPKHYLF